MKQKAAPAILCLKACGRRRSPLRRTPTLLLALGVLAAPACRPDGPTASRSATQPAEAIHVSLETPQEAARSVLTCLQARRRARVSYGDQAADWYREELRATAARDVILNRYKAARRPARDEDEIFDRFIEGWGPIIGFYADGLQLDRMVVAPRAPNAQEAEVQVPAVPISGQGGHATIRVECVRGRDDRWRVARIDFWPAPASPPATAAAP